MAPRISVIPDHSGPTLDELEVVPQTELSTIWMDLRRLDLAGYLAKTPASNLHQPKT